MTVALETNVNGITVIAASGASQALSSASGQLDPAYDVTLTANCTFTLAATVLARVQTILVRLTQDATGNRVPSFPASVAWDLGALPAFSTTPGVKDTVLFQTWDGGATWSGSVVSLGSVTPAAPDAPTATVLPGHGQSRLYIFDGLPHGAPITAHAIYRSTTSGFTPSAGNLVATYNTSSGFIYTDTGLTDGTTYYYVIAAINAIGPSIYSPQYTVTPSNNRYLVGTSAGNVYTSGTIAANQATEGYIDIQAYVALTDITATNTILSRWAGSAATSVNSSWILQLTSGSPILSWYDASTTTIHQVTSSATLTSAASSLPYIANGNPFWLRAVMNNRTQADAPNGFASGSVTFQTAPDNGSGAPGTWTTLGTVATNAGTNGLREPATTPNQVVGTINASNPFVGKYYKANLYSSTGALKIGVDVTSLFSGQTGTFQDNAATPNTFIINGTIN